MLSVSAGATAGTIPILASAFNRISIFSVITNVIIIPFASVTIILVFIATLLGLIIIPLGVFAAHVAAVFIQVLSAVVDWIASFPLVAADMENTSLVVDNSVFHITAGQFKICTCQNESQSLAECRAYGCSRCLCSVNCS